MPESATDRKPHFSFVDRGDGQLFVIFNSATLGNLSEGEPLKWYACPFHFPDRLGDAYNSMEDVERAVRAWHAE